METLEQMVFLELLYVVTNDISDPINPSYSKGNPGARGVKGDQGPIGPAVSIVEIGSVPVWMNHDGNRVLKVHLESKDPLVQLDLKENLVQQVSKELTVSVVTRVTLDHLVHQVKQEMKD